MRIRMISRLYMAPVQLRSLPVLDLLGFNLWDSLDNY